MGFVLFADSLDSKSPFSDVSWYSEIFYNSLVVVMAVLVPMRNHQNISYFVTIEERSVSWIASFCHDFFKKTKKNYLRGFLMVLSFHLIELLFPYALTSFLSSKRWQVCRVDLRFSLFFRSLTEAQFYMNYAKHPPDKTCHLTIKGKM